MDTRPTEQYSDIDWRSGQTDPGTYRGCRTSHDTQRKVAKNIISLKMLILIYFSSRFINLVGPPGTGKTLMASACAAQTQSCFLKLTGPQLVQMFIGDGAKLVTDTFALAKEKAPAIIFIDKLDATPSLPRDLTLRRLETERFKEPCWSCSISWTVSHPMMTSR